MTEEQLRALQDELRGIEDPGERIRVALTTAGAKGAIGTSGQLTGAVMVDLAWRAGVTPRVFSIDTLRLFPETYQFMAELTLRYRVEIEWFRPEAQALQRMIRSHGEWLFFDSKAKQEYCCDIRKVEPNQRALETVDVWLTGLRRDQSSERSNVDFLSLVPHRGTDGELRHILKVAPMFDWTEADLRVYCRDNGVPVHPLLRAPMPDGWRYESVGCRICTTPSGPHEARRAGRWRWFNANTTGSDSKECGIHLEHGHSNTESQ